MELVIYNTRMSRILSVKISILKFIYLILKFIISMSREIFNINSAYAQPIGWPGPGEPLTAP